MFKFTVMLILKIGIKGDVYVSWKVYRCSKSDQIYIYPVNGKSYVSSSLSNKNKSLESEGKLKVSLKTYTYMHVNRI